MTSYATPAQVAKGRRILAELNGCTATIGVSHTALVTLPRPGGDVLQELARVQAHFQLRAIVAQMGFQPCSVPPSAEPTSAPSPTPSPEPACPASPEPPRSPAP